MTFGNGIDTIIIHLTTESPSMSTKSDDQSDREQARESLLSGGERVSKGRQRGESESEDKDE